MELTLDNFKTAYPDLFKQIDADAYQRGLAEGKTIGADAGMKAGAQKERDRIQAVEAQALPGHEKLIAELKFDGITSGPEAAVKVLAAEKTLVTVKKDVFLTEHVTAAPVPAPAVEPEKVSSGEAPKTEAEMKAVWDKDESIRAEFGNSFEAYTAYLGAAAAGQVKIYGETKGGK